jgi:hypothetical protein
MKTEKTKNHLMMSKTSDASAQEGVLALIVHRTMSAVLFKSWKNDLCAGRDTWYGDKIVRFQLYSAAEAKRRAEYHKSTGVSDGFYAEQCKRIRISAEWKSLILR